MVFSVGMIILNYSFGSHFSHITSLTVDGQVMQEYSDGSMNSSEDTGGQICHQCRRNDRDRVIWCQKCDKRGYCDNCISTW